MGADRALGRGPDQPGLPAQGDHRRTEDLLRATIESTADGLLVVDENGRTLFANRQFAEMWCIPQELLEAGSDDRLLAFVLDQLADPDAFLAKVRELYGTTREDLDTLYFKDGRVFERYSRPLLSEGGVGGRVWSFRDVSTRRRSEAALRRSEKKYETLVENIPAVTYIAGFGESGAWDYVSPQIETMLGFKPDEWQRDPDLWFRQIHPEDRARALQDEANSRRSGEPLASEYRMLTASGRTIWIRDEAVLVRDEDGRPLHWQGFMFDVTEHKRAEEASREAEIKYRTLIEQIPAITYVDAVSGGPETTLYISPQTETMLGYTTQDWLDDPDLLSKRIHPDDRDRWRAENAHIDQTGVPFSLEYRILTRDDRVIWVQDRAVLVRDEKDRPLYWQGVMFDITERKESEGRLERLWQQELEAGQRLRALDEMKNTFLQAVSHELRTPLTTILGGALTLERLGQELTPEESGDLLRRLTSNAKKLNRLLSDLLDLDRLARGILEPKIQEADVGELVRGIVDESEELLGGHPVHTDVESVVLGVEPAKVERIVENLLANTARHTPPGTPVWVRVTGGTEGATIVVEDAGPGIPEEVRRTIFEPFQQLRASQTPTPGVGIGLSLVARFAELHGGRAWVEDRAGGGASFRVFLPRTMPAAEGERRLPKASGQ
jgi:PAS domain S-box-containing protein